MPRSTICRSKDPDGTPCPNPTSDPSKRCPLHAHASFGDRFRPSARPPSHPVYHSRRWRKMRKELLAEWVAKHGWVCPGWRTPPHPASRFAIDHVIPLIAGGRPFDRTNLRVLCGSCNSRKSLHDRHERG